MKKNEPEIPISLLEIWYRNGKLVDPPTNPAIHKIIRLALGALESGEITCISPSQRGEEYGIVGFEFGSNLYQLNFDEDFYLDPSISIFHKGWETKFGTFDSIESEIRDDLCAHLITISEPSQENKRKAIEFMSKVMYDLDRL